LKVVIRDLNSNLTYIDFYVRIKKSS